MRTFLTVLSTLVLAACGGGTSTVPDTAVVSSGSMSYTAAADGQHTLGAVYSLATLAGEGVSVGIIGHGATAAPARSDEPTHTACVVLRKGQIVQVTPSIFGYSGSSAGEVFVRVGC